MRRMFFGALMASTVSACSPLGDGIIIIGSPEGIRAMSDGLNGAIAQSKTQKKGGETAYWRHRETETTKPSVWETLSQGLIATREATDETR